MTLNAGELKVPGGKDYHDGDNCEGKPGRVQVQVFANSTDTTGTLWGRRLPVPSRSGDGQMLTIAFVPKGATIPPPPAAIINNLPIHLNDVAPATRPLPPAAARPRRRPHRRRPRRPGDHGPRPRRATTAKK